MGLRRGQAHLRPVVVRPSEQRRSITLTTIKFREHLKKVEDTMTGFMDQIEQLSDKETYINVETAILRLSAQYPRVEGD